jgi:DNA-binding MarR family transcriptional regulator
MTSLVPGGIASHTSCLLVKLGQVAYRLQETRLAELDLRVRHFSVLQGLADEGPIVQLELGRHLRIDPATMATTLDHLERRGAVSRERSAEDRRRYVVALTPEGTRLLAAARERLDEVDALLATDLGATKGTALTRALTALADSATLIEAVDRSEG